jgi:hypothetical protein
MPRACEQVDIVNQHDYSMFGHRLVKRRCDRDLAVVSVESVGARIGAHNWYQFRGDVVR